MLNFRQDKAFAQQLVAEIAEQVSIEVLRDNRKAISVNKMTRVLEKVYLQVSKHQVQQRMGFLRRSLFANHFQWALKDLSYPKDFIVVATEGLVVALSAKPATTPRDGAK